MDTSVIDPTAERRGSVYVCARCPGFAALLIPGAPEETKHLAVEER